jgi:hypothetical protein
MMNLRRNTWKKKVLAKDLSILENLRACCTNPFHKLSDIGKIGLSIEGGRDGIQLD